MVHPTGRDAPAAREPGDGEAILGTLLGLSPGARVAVLASHQDEVSQSLAALGCRVTTFTADPALASALTAADARIETQIIASLSDLPTSDAQFDAVILAEAAFLAASIPLAESLTCAASLLRPGGILCVTVTNPLMRFGLYRAAIARAETLSRGDRDRENKTEGTLRDRVPTPRDFRAALRNAGLTVYAEYAPIPSACRPEFVIPLDDPAIAAHLFRRLLPRPSLLFAALFSLAAPLARAGLLPIVLPHRYFFAEKTSHTD